MVVAVVVVEGTHFSSVPFVHILGKMSWVVNLYYYYYYDCCCCCCCCSTVDYYYGDYCCFHHFVGQLHSFAWPPYFNNFQHDAQLVRRQSIFHASFYYCYRCC